MNDNENVDNYAINLISRSTVIEDFDDAVDALSELGKIDPYRAAEISLQILRQKIGDKFYRATAFETLYSISIVKAVEYIKTNAENEDIYTLGTMLTCITVDSGALEDREEIMKAVPILRGVLLHKPAEMLQEIASSIEWFDNIYSTSLAVNVAH